MLQIEVLVVELVSIDGLATSAVSVGEVAALGHESGDNAVELASLEVEVFARVALAGGSVSESGEVLGSLGHGVTEHSHDDAASRLTVDLNVEVDFLGDLSERFSENSCNEGCKERENLHFKLKLIS